jgi:FlaA1/EpsC-like NDP-sugar epimerase
MTTHPTPAFQPSLPPHSFALPRRRQAVQVPTPTSRDRRVQAGVLLVGTPETLTQIRGMLASDADAPVLTGCVVPQGMHATDSAGSPVLGTIEELPAISSRHRPRLAIVCLPASLGAAAVRTSELLRLAGITERTVPALCDLFAEPAVERFADNGADTALLSSKPAIDMAKLIGREPYRLDRDAVNAVLAGKRVLITGAGGSIGSELSRLCAGFEPSQIVLMERSENALFEIDRQIAHRFPNVPRRAILHDVVDSGGTHRLLSELRPHAVFHSAAHKHVPLMEDHPAHALTNNLFGTKAIADAAAACGAERFVMISSDKAVNPTSVMGATKRLAEIYVSWLASRTGMATRMSMVRFGNVLGSACSVLTIWSSQLAEGGPITVTDERMTRYFMTIHEAATLVLQSATLDPVDADGSTRRGRAGMYVLDMGEPVRIVELAQRFAGAHGLTARLPGEATNGPAVDVGFTGARPGEKIHEELAYASEHLRPTTHPGIRAWAGDGAEPLSDGTAQSMLNELGALQTSVDPATVIAALQRYVPEMRRRPA